MAKEIYDEDTQEWYPEIDLKSPERQFKYREEELRLWGGSLDKELKEIEEFVQQLLNDWPGLEREKIQISTEAVPEPYEDWHYGVLNFSFYTLESDLEWKERVAGLSVEKEGELDQLKQLMEKYPKEAKELINKNN